VSVSSGMHFDNILVASSPANFFKKISIGLMAGIE
jgi:hypothetical protein